jgi:NTE family protein
MIEADEDGIEGTSHGGRGLALVLSGGGARAAYQVGVLRGLARRRPGLPVPIVAGVSAGAINAACLAAHPHDLAASVERLRSLWGTLEVERVFRVDPWSLAGSVLRWGYRLVSGGGRWAPEVRGMVDTSPLRELLEQSLNAEPDGTIAGVSENIASGALHALTVLTSNYETGQTVAWVEGEDAVSWQRPQRRSRRAQIGVDHIMASAALPFFFPAVRVEGMWHGDGGIRLTNPLSPAIHLGADRILAISTRARRSEEEANRSQLRGYPPPLQIGGQLLNAVFLDALDQDALRIERFNRLLRELPPERRHGLRVVDAEVLRPSRDLGMLAAEYEPELPGLFRHLVRSVGSRETSSPDLLSLVMFQADYCKRLMEIGEADADARMDRILALVDG